MASLLAFGCCFALLITIAQCGCWERRICCSGRNVSCSSSDSETGWHVHMDSKVKMPPGYQLEDFFEGLYTAQKRLAKLRSPAGLNEVDFNEELLVVTTADPSVQRVTRRRTKEFVIDVNQKRVEFIVSPSTPPTTTPTTTPEIKDPLAFSIGETEEESSGDVPMPKVEKFGNLRLDNLRFVFADGTNASATSLFHLVEETVVSTTTVSPVAGQSVISAQYSTTPKPTATDPHETLRLIFDDSGDFISIEKHIVNDTNDWIVDADPLQSHSDGNNRADRMLGDQPRGNTQPRTALDSVISYVVVDEHILPESLEKYGKMQEYLGRQPKGKICYCDDVCGALKDCCRDYEAVCPAVDCRVGSWSEWSGCEVVENDPQVVKTACGEGISRRTRVVLESSDNGGAKCPVLEERRACFNAGPPCNEGISEVALLLPHKYGAARVPGQKNNVYYDIPKVTAKYNNMNSYCIHFHLNYLNQHCTDTAVRETFLSAQQICVECQPTAQLAKERCNGEGAPEIRTLFNILNVPQCFGFWTQVQTITKCSCNETSTSVPAFIFV